MAKQKKMMQKKEDYAGLFIPAGLFIGLALGAVYSNYAAGVLGGLGCGFLAMALVRLLR